MNIKLSDLHTAVEIAEKFGLSPRTVKEWCRIGTLPARQLGAQWFVTSEDLAAFVLSRPVSGRISEPLAPKRAKLPRVKSGGGWAG